ncbi:carbohydrate ABC transporter permease [Phyllobacterium myrsinacearum]|uniref:Sugar ABC transporter permease n=1 Tax=Phyllobacterium myrsinacearum TaxID=28101 RepID=A0A2S9JFN5_9HYPH|nr:sugar ABC transporter permease [Phyllobacterium myrsinacearum]PRD51731.1 sugar ABC transporter permease [Phyllobacterium myrsinacearum]PWV86291.1 carbohydrate ABC transporter membrane protein 1 (CUT1 family) [Phyllobacterium myrsinacearum]RZV00016.1 carbohydrate ABC transporter membrane protein 1 (CUT1 family) [Phyllobacterium myrsinacearum]
MKRKTTLPAVFLIPPLIILAILAFVPTIAAVNIALQNRELSFPNSSYVWFANFIDLFGDRRFVNAIWISLIWEVVTVTATLVVAVLLAIFLFETASPRMRSLVSILFIIPVMLPRVSAAFVWKFMFNPLFGLINYPVKLLTGAPIDFLSLPATALASVAVVDVWQWGLFFSVIVLKLLETLPPQPFEAARLDNAKTWEVHFYIGIPMLAAPLISLVFVKMVESLRAFDLIYVMTRGGPGIATETLDMYAFSQGFVEAGKISYASSMAVLMMLATIITFTVLWKWVRKWQ